MLWLAETEEEELSGNGTSDTARIAMVVSGLVEALEC